jgi:hypothetical protein
VSLWVQVSYPHPDGPHSSRGGFFFELLWTALLVQVTLNVSTPVHGDEEVGVRAARPSIVEPQCRNPPSSCIAYPRGLFAQDAWAAASSNNPGVAIGFTVVSGARGLYSGQSVCITRATDEALHGGTRLMATRPTHANKARQGCCTFPR